MRRPLLASLVLLGLACSSPRPASERPTPADFVLSFGEGGGFTGRWSGFTVEADGTVMRWEGDIARENPRPAGRLTPAQVDSLWLRLRDARFFDRRVQEPGNVTGYLQAVAGADTNTVLWPRLSDREEALPELLGLYLYAGRLVQRRTQ